MILNAIYNKNTGRLTNILECPLTQVAANLALLPTTHKSIETVISYNTDTYFIDVQNSEIIPRPENPTTINGYILTNLPVPSTVRIGTEEFLVEDGELEMAFDLPGTYTINVDSFPFQDATFEVTV
jgi:hypothetical protein